MKKSVRDMIMKTTNMLEIDTKECESAILLDGHVLRDVIECSIFGRFTKVYIVETLGGIYIWDENGRLADIIPASVKLLIEKAVALTLGLKDLGF